MTKRKTLFAAIIMASMQSAFCQSPIAEAWKSMPDSIIPILNANARGELLEMAKFGSTAIATKNLLGGECRLVAMTDSLIDVRLTKKTGVQLLLLEKSDSTRLICMNKYFGDPIIDSDISFYTEDWKRDATIKLPAISADEYFNSVSAANDSTKTDGVDNISLHPVVTAAELSDKNNGEILLTANTPLAINTDKKGKTTHKLQKSLKWDGDTFK